MGQRMERRPTALFDMETTAEIAATKLKVQLEVRRKQQKEKIKLRLQNRHGFDNDLLASSDSASDSNSESRRGDKNGDYLNMNSFEDSVDKDDQILGRTMYTDSDSVDDSDGNTTPIVAIKSKQRKKRNKTKFQRRNVKKSSRKTTHKKKSQKREKISNRVKAVQKGSIASDTETATDTGSDNDNRIT